MAPFFLNTSFQKNPVCGIFGGNGASKRELALLKKSLKNRGPDLSGISKIGKLSIGETGLLIVGKRKAKPPFVSKRGKVSLVHNGEWYSFPEDLSGKTGTDSEAISNLIEKEGARALSEIDGPFALAWIEEGHLYTARDFLGVRPLFLGGGMFASEGKALLKAGVSPGEISRQEPGTIYRDGKFFAKIPFKFQKPKGSLPELIELAVEKMVFGLERATVAFSGGVDSAIVGKIASERLKKTTCIVAGIPGSQDFERAENAANLLGLKLRKIVLKVNEKTLQEVSETIETADPVQIGIAFSPYSIAKKAKGNVILTGQGADELFCGYRKYYSVPEEEAEKLHRADVFSIGEKNCERDYMAAGKFGKELRQPFLDREIVNFALGLKIGEKLADRENRKIILRKAAISLGIPEKIAFEPKKAIQYSTGVMREIEQFGRQLGGKQ